MNLILFFILVGLVIYIYRSDKIDWVEVYEEDEESLNKVQLRIKYLKDKGVKSRLKAPGSRGISFQKPGDEIGKVKIIVRKKDEEKARELLEEYLVE